MRMQASYAAQAAQSMKGWIESTLRNTPRVARDLELIETQFRQHLEGAHHFVLPSGGSILNDDLRGLAGVDARLPFPEITLSYHIDADDAVLPPGTVHAPRRLIYAREVNAADLGAYQGPEFGDRFRDGAVEVLSANQLLNTPDQFWAPQMFGAMVPRATPLRPDGRWEFAIFCLLPTLIEDVRSELGNADFKRLAYNDVASDMRAVLELVEALSCVNVKPQCIKGATQAVNARRVRGGKLPLLDTWVLTIDATRTFRGAGRDVGGDRNGPRQHLRRGHIRRLGDGRKVWVNATVVGAASNGRISKTYQLTKGGLTMHNSIGGTEPQS